jgi:adenylate cyclase
MTGNAKKTATSSPAPEIRSTGWRGWLIVLGLSLAVALTVALVDHYGYFEKPDLLGYDFLVKTQGPAPPSERVLFIDFDEASVTAYHVYRIPRDLLTSVITKTASGNPSAIGLDVLLDEARLPAKDDEKLAEAINDAGNVLLVSEYGFMEHEPSEPIALFQKAASGVAFGDLLSDPDGSVRRMFLALTDPKYTKYKRRSFPVALVTLANDSPETPWKLGAPQDGHVQFGPHKIPLATTTPPTVWIHFHPSPPVRSYSVKDLLSPGFDTSVFKDKIIVIGETSERGKDSFNTPVSSAGVRINGRDILCGAEIHAAAAETLLTGHTLQTAPPYTHWLCAFVLTFLVAACGYMHRWFISVGATLLLLAGVVALAFYLFTYQNLWGPFVSTEVCLLLALPAGLGYRSVEERRLKRLMEAERGQIMGLFERYVSADVAAEIWKRRDQIVLAGEERTATILFSDIRSFTAMTCNVPSKVVLEWLNGYLTMMGDIIKKNGGFLNKFIGDGIMVVFGAPLSESPKEDAQRAVRCALEMLACLDQWNASRNPNGKSLNDHPLKIGVGIHTGVVTAGNVGSPDRLEYSVIGEAVNLASRLEALTKELGSPIVISPATCELICDEFSTVSLGGRLVRGFTQELTLYGVAAKSPVEVHS